MWSSTGWVKYVLNCVLIQDCIFLQAMHGDQGCSWAVVGGSVGEPTTLV